MPTFTITLDGGSERNTMGIVVPPALIEALGAGKRPKLTVTMNGVSYRTTVGVMGGLFMIPVAAEQRARCGVRPGDVVAVTIELDTAPRVVEAPPDFLAALEAAGARETWDRLAFTHQKEQVHAIEEAKAPETRLRRIDKAVAMVVAKKG